MARLTTATIAAPFEVVVDQDRSQMPSPGDNNGSRCTFGAPLL